MRIRNKKTQQEAWLHHFMAMRLLCAITWCGRHVFTNCNTVKRNALEYLLRKWVPQTKSADGEKRRTWILGSSDHRVRVEWISVKLVYNYTFPLCAFSHRFSRQYLDKTKATEIRGDDGFFLCLSGQVVMVMWNQIPGQEYKLPCGEDYEVTKASRTNQSAIRVK
jgi:hypothetical protein